MKDNCLALCLQYLLNEEVPNLVGEYGDFWFPHVYKWLYKKGIQLVWIPLEITEVMQFHKDVPYIFCGLTDNGQGHATIRVDDIEVFNPGNHELINIHDVYVLKGHQQ